MTDTATKLGPRVVALTAAAAATVMAFAAHGQPRTALTFDQAVERAARAAPEIAVAQSGERVARAEIQAADVYPNPTVFAGTSTQSARLSGGVSIPLVLLGQRGAAVRASRAEYRTARADSELVRNEARTGAAHAFVALWLSQQLAEARAEDARLVGRIGQAVQARIEHGSAPDVEGLRAHAEVLRAAADSAGAAEGVAAAASELARWIDTPLELPVRAAGGVPAPESLPPLGALLRRAADAPEPRREQLDALAAEARADRERAAVRPTFSLDLGFDLFDPGLPAPDYHVQLACDVPVFNQGGAHVRRELASAAAARARARAARTRASAALATAWHGLASALGRRAALAEGVVPANDRAARATEDSYALGHAPLVAVLDASRARIDARVALLEARAAVADAWIDIQDATGWSR